MTSVTLSAADLFSVGKIDVFQNDMNIGETFSTLTREYTLTAKDPLVSYTFSYTEITQEQQYVRIYEEDTPTQGFMELQGFNFTVPAGNTGDRSIFEIDIEQAINIYQIVMIGREANLGDTVSMWIGPTYYIGAITTDIIPGDTSAVVTSVPLANMKVGWTLGVKNGSNPIEPVGRISSIDTENSRLVFRKPTTHTMPSGSLVYAWIPRGTNVPLINGPLHYGQGKIGGSYAMKGLRVTFHYTNNSSQQKTFSIVCEDTF